MPILRYLADTNAISDCIRRQAEVLSWFEARQAEIGISTLTLAEIRRGIEFSGEGKRRRELEKLYQFILQDYHGAIFVFDEAAAAEWGRLMLESIHHPLPYEDSLIAAIARSSNLVVVTRNTKHFPTCATINPWDGSKHGPWRGQA